MHVAKTIAVAVLCGVCNACAWLAVAIHAVTETRPIPIGTEESFAPTLAARHLADVLVFLARPVDAMDTTRVFGHGVELCAINCYSEKEMI